MVPLVEPLLLVNLLTIELLQILKLPIIFLLASALLAHRSLGHVLKVILESPICGYETFKLIVLFVDEFLQLGQLALFVLLRLV